MGYSVEISFNVLKSGSVTELQENVRSYAKECDCEQFYDDYEFENKSQFQRRHCIMTAIFAPSNIINLVKFLKFIKNMDNVIFEKKNILVKPLHALHQSPEEFIKDLHLKNKTMLEILKTGIVLSGAENLVKIIREERA